MVFKLSASYLHYSFWWIFEIFITHELSLFTLAHILINEIYNCFFFRFWNDFFETNIFFSIFFNDLKRPVFCSETKKNSSCYSIVSFSLLLRSSVSNGRPACYSIISFTLLLHNCILIFLTVFYRDYLLNGSIDFHEIFRTNR